MLLSEENVPSLAAAIEPGSSAGALVWENTCRTVRLCRTPFGRSAGGQRPHPHPGDARRSRS